MAHLIPNIRGGTAMASWPRRRVSCPGMAWPRWPSAHSGGCQDFPECRLLTPDTGLPEAASPESPRGAGQGTRRPVALGREWGLGIHTRFS